MLCDKGAFRGLFLDKHLSDTELEGGVTHTAMQGVASAVLRILDGPLSSPLQQVLDVPSTHLPQLRTFARVLQHCSLIEGIKDEETRVREMLRTLSSLEVGEYALPNSGWSTGAGGHAVMLCIVREADQTEGGGSASASGGSGAPDSQVMHHLRQRRYTLTVLNTGSGSEYHSAREQSGPRNKQQYRQGLAFSGIPGWRLLDPSFHYLLLSLHCSASDSNCSAALYELLLPYLTGDDPVGAIQAARALDRQGPYASPQAAGFCFSRCVFAALRYCAAVLWKWDAAQVKRLMLAHRLAWLAPAAQELQAASPATRLTESELAATLLAARQCSRALGKALAKGQLPPGSCQSGEGLIQGALAHLRACAAQRNLNVPGLLSVSGSPLCSNLPQGAAMGTEAYSTGSPGSSSCFLPPSAAAWPRLELIGRLGEAESPAECAIDSAWAGAPTECAAQSNLSLALVAQGQPLGRDTSWTPLHVCQALACALTNAHSLRNSETGGAGTPQQYLVQALVEDLLFETLPPPCLPGGWAVAAAAGGRAAPPGFTKAVQLEGLRSALLLLQHYCAARASTPPRLGGRILFGVALGALAAVADALARVPASDGALPLTAALLGGGAQGLPPMGFWMPHFLTSPAGYTNAHFHAHGARAQQELVAYWKAVNSPVGRVAAGGALAGGGGGAAAAPAAPAALLTPFCEAGATPMSSLRHSGGMTWDSSAPVLLSVSVLQSGGLEIVRRWCEASDGGKHTLPSSVGSSSSGARYGTAEHVPRSWASYEAMGAGLTEASERPKAAQLLYLAGWLKDCQGDLLLYRNHCMLTWEAWCPKSALAPLFRWRAGDGPREFTSYDMGTGAWKFTEGPLDIKTTPDSTPPQVCWAEGSFTLGGTALGYDAAGWNSLDAGILDSGLIDIVPLLFGKNEPLRGEGDAAHVSQAVALSDATFGEVGVYQQRINPKDLPDYLHLKGLPLVDLRETMLLLSAPYIRAPLLLAFMRSRSELLACRGLRDIVALALFEPLFDFSGRGAPPPPTTLPPLPPGADPEEAWAAVLGNHYALLPVPPTNRRCLLSSPTGLLHQELLHAPAPLLDPFLHLLHTAATKVGELAGALAPVSPTSAYMQALHWCVRVGALLEGHLATAAALAPSGVRKEALLGYLERLEEGLRSGAQHSSEEVQGDSSAHPTASSALSLLHRSLEHPDCALLDASVSARVHAHIVLCWSAVSGAARMGAAGRDTRLLGLSGAPGLACGFAQVLTSGTHVAQHFRLKGAEAGQGGQVCSDDAAQVAREAAAAAAAEEQATALPAGVELDYAPWGEAFAAVLRHRAGVLTWLAALPQPAQQSTLTATLQYARRLLPAGFGQAQPELPALRWRSGFGEVFITEPVGVAGDVFTLLPTGFLQNSRPPCRLTPWLLQSGDFKVACLGPRSLRSARIEQRPPRKHRASEFLVNYVAEGQAGEAAAVAASTQYTISVWNSLHSGSPALGAEAAAAVRARDACWAGGAGGGGSLVGGGAATATAAPLISRSFPYWAPPSQPADLSTLKPVHDLFPKLAGQCLHFGGRAFTELLAQSTGCSKSPLSHRSAACTGDAELWARGALGEALRGAGEGVKAFTFHAPASSGSSSEGWLCWVAPSPTACVPLKIGEWRHAGNSSATIEVSEKEVWKRVRYGRGESWGERSLFAGKHEVTAAFFSSDPAPGFKDKTIQTYGGEERVYELGTFLEVVGMQAATGSPGVQAFQLLDLGRYAQRCLVYSTDSRRALCHLQPSLLPRARPLPEHLQWASEHACGTAVVPRPPEMLDKQMQRTLVEDAPCMGRLCLPLGRARQAYFSGVLNSPYGAKVSGDSSLRIHRAAWVGGVEQVETYVPERALAGLLPEALLDEYDFFVRSGVPGGEGGGREMVGYPHTAPPGTAAPELEAQLLRVALQPGAPARITLPCPPPADLASALSALHCAAGQPRLEQARTLLCASLAHCSSQLGRLHALFSRIESASHVLYWGRRVELPWAAVAAPFYVLEAVQLPRLKLSFSTRFEAGPGGLPQGAYLHSDEYSDYDLCRESLPGLQAQQALGVEGGAGDASTRPTLERLSLGLPFSLLLQHTREPGRYALLAPSYTLRRPTIGMQPFLTTLRPALRADWHDKLSAMRVLLLPVHPSAEFLAPKGDRAFSLLHVSQLLWGRRYGEAAALLHTARLDVRVSKERPPTSSGEAFKHNVDLHRQAPAVELVGSSGEYLTVPREQLWLLQGALASGDDSHPDAAALRLRLVVMALECMAAFATGGKPADLGLAEDTAAGSGSPYAALGLGNGDPWGVAQCIFHREVLRGVAATNVSSPGLDFGIYCRAIGHVSPACKLSDWELRCVCAITGSAYRPSPGPPGAGGAVTAGGKLLEFTRKRKELWAEVVSTAEGKPLPFLADLRNSYWNKHYIPAPPLGTVIDSIALKGGALSEGPAVGAVAVSKRLVDIFSRGDGELTKLSEQRNSNSVGSVAALLLAQIGYAGTVARSVPAEAHVAAQVAGPAAQPAAAAMERKCLVCTLANEVEAQVCAACGGTLGSPVRAEAAGEEEEEVGCGGGAAASSAAAALPLAAAAAASTQPAAAASTSSAATHDFPPAPLAILSASATPDAGLHLPPHLAALTLASLLARDWHFRGKIGGSHHARVLTNPVLGVLGLAGMAVEGLTAALCRGSPPLTVQVAAALATAFPPLPAIALYESDLIIGWGRCGGAFPDRLSSISECFPSWYEENKGRGVSAMCSHRQAHLRALAKQKEKAVVEAFQAATGWHAQLVTAVLQLRPHLGGGWVGWLRAGESSSSQPQPAAASGAVVPAGAEPQPPALATFAAGTHALCGQPSKALQLLLLAPWVAPQRLETKDTVAGDVPLPASCTPGDLALFRRPVGQLADALGPPLARGGSGAAAASAAAAAAAASRRRILAALDAHELHSSEAGDDLITRLKRADALLSSGGGGAGGVQLPASLAPLQEAAQALDALVLSHPPPHPPLTAALCLLDTLLAQLTTQRASALTAAAALRLELHALPPPLPPSHPQHCSMAALALLQELGAAPRPTPLSTLACALSSTGAADLLLAGAVDAPLAPLPLPARLCAALLWTLWHTNAAHLGFVSRCLGVLRERLLSAQQAGVLGSREEVAGIQAELPPLLEQLCSKGLAQGRGWMAGAAAALKPRRAYSEFMNSSLLYNGQNALVDDFEGALAGGGSLLQQLMMGQGKTQVLTPLIALLLGDGRTVATVITSIQLLPQIAEPLTGMLSNACLDKPLLQLRVQRGLGRNWRALGAGTRELVALGEAIARVRGRGGVLLAGPESIKSLILTASDLRLGSSSSERALNEPSHRAAAAIVALFHARSTAIVDECDLVLHPLKSELNYPLGTPQELRVGLPGTGQQRYSLPIFLVEALLSIASWAAAVEAAAAAAAAVPAAGALVGGGSARAPSTPAPPSPAEQHARSRVHECLGEADMPLALQLREALLIGRSQHRALQLSPLWLFDEAYYAEALAPCLAGLVVRWVEEGAGGQAAQEALKAVLGATPTLRPSLLALLRQPLSSAMASALGDAFNGAALLPLLLFAQSLVSSILPNALTRQHSVHYGLLPNSAVQAPPPGRPAPPSRTDSRRYLAVPYLGKDTPSPSSEFSHPDVRSIFTIISYSRQGLRAEDVSELLSACLARLAEESKSAAVDRGLCRSACEWEAWKAMAGDVGDWEAEQNGQGGEGVRAAARNLPPLDVLEKTPGTLLQAFAALRFLPAVRRQWLEHVLGRCNTAYAQTLTASGHDLGSSMLFSQRLGFSGTPNSLVPISLLPVRTQDADESQILRLLTDPGVVQVAVPGRSEEGEMLGILKRAARGGFLALVDVGALVTGLGNREVAAALLCLGLRQCRGAVYVDEDSNDIMVLQRPVEGGGRSRRGGGGAAAAPRLTPTQHWACAACTFASNHASSAACELCKAPAVEGGSAGAAPYSASSGGSAGGSSSGGPPPQQADCPTLEALRCSPAFRSLMAATPIRRSRCGVPLQSLFAFYDQTHTTGTHVDLSPTARGLATVAATTTYRDLAQGAWRLRKLGAGQTLQVLLPPDMAHNARKVLRKVGFVGGEEGGVGGGGAAAPFSPAHLAAFLLVNTLGMEAKQAAALGQQRLGHGYRAAALRPLAGPLVGRGGFSPEQLLSAPVQGVAGEVEAGLKGAADTSEVARCFAAAGGQLIALLAPQPSVLQPPELKRLLEVESPSAFQETHSREFPAALAAPATLQEGVMARLRTRPLLLAHAMVSPTEAVELAMTVGRAAGRAAAAAAAGREATWEEAVQPGSQLLSQLELAASSEAAAAATAAAVAAAVAKGMDSTQSSEAQTTLQQKEQLQEQELQLPSPDPARAEWRRYSVRALAVGGLAGGQGGVPGPTIIKPLCAFSASPAVVGKREGAAAAAGAATAAALIRLPAPSALFASDNFLHSEDERTLRLPAFLPSARLLLTVAVEAVERAGLRAAVPAAVTAAAMRQQKQQQQQQRQPASPPELPAPSSPLRKCIACTHVTSAAACEMCKGRAFVAVNSAASRVAAARAAASSHQRAAAAAAVAMAAASSAYRPPPLFSLLLCLKEGESLRPALWRLASLPPGALRTAALPPTHALHLDLWLLCPERQTMEARHRLAGFAARGAGGGSGVLLARPSQRTRAALIAHAAHARFFDGCSSGSHSEEVAALFEEPRFGSGLSALQRTALYTALRPAHRYRSERGGDRHPALLVESGAEWARLAGVLQAAAQVLLARHGVQGGLPQVFLHLASGLQAGNLEGAARRSELVKGKLDVGALQRECWEGLGRREGVQEDVKVLVELFVGRAANTLSWENFATLMSFAGGGR